MLNMTINVVGPLRENCYFVYNEAKKLVIVDPGDWAGSLLAEIGELQYQPEAVLLTHGHFDHIGAVREILEAYPGTPLYAFEEEKVILEDAAANGSRSFGAREFCIDKVRYLKDRDIITLLGTEWELISTPGHTVGSACYYVAEAGILFSGDTLFAGDCGRTDLITGSTEDMIHSIREVLMSLPDDTKVYPGHGVSTSIGAERRQNYIMRM